jgi:hypothetical protein
MFIIAKRDWELTALHLDLHLLLNRQKSWHDPTGALTEASEPSPAAALRPLYVR